MYRQESRCPYCGNSIERSRIKSITCEKKSYVFPYWIYWCPKHGYFVWKGSCMGNELLGFINKCNEAIRVESVEFAFPIYGPTLEDYRIVEMECPQCGSPLSQYYSTLLGDVRVHCPDCGSEIPKNKALKSKRF